MAVVAVIVVMIDAIGLIAGGGSVCGNNEVVVIPGTVVLVVVIMVINDINEVTVIKVVRLLYWW